MGQGHANGHLAKLFCQNQLLRKPGPQEADLGWAVSLLIKLIRTARCRGPQPCVGMVADLKVQ